jgi:hypothetical protein
MWRQGEVRVSFWKSEVAGKKDLLEWNGRI